MKPDAEKIRQLAEAEAGGPPIGSALRQAWVKQQRAALRKRSRMRPGRQFTVRTRMVELKNLGREDVLDEVVIDDWLHLEQMDTRSWWMQLGTKRIWIKLPTNPKREPEITIEEDGP